MFAYVLLSLLLALVSIDVVDTATSPDAAWVLGVTAALVVAVWVAGVAISAYILWRGRDLERAEQRFLRRVGLMGKAYRLTVLGAYATCLFALRWPALAQVWIGETDWQVLPLAVSLAPLVVLLTVAWTALYWADRRLKAAMVLRSGAAMPPPTWTLPAYLAFMFRQYLLVLMLPVLALVAVSDLVAWWLGPEDTTLAGLGLRVLMIAAAAALSGPWVRLCWHTEPMPDGDLRRRLTALAARAGVRVGEILVWRTRLSIANGCMIGILGPMRYILITDALLLSLTPAEVEAVFAHEVAHVKYRHVPFFMVMAMAGASLSLLVGEALAGLDAGVVAANVAVTALILGYWWFAFGFLSRRCEQECDLFAARATECPAGCSPPDAGRQMSFGLREEEAAAVVAPIEEAVISPAEDAVILLVEGDEDPAEVFTEVAAEIPAAPSPAPPASLCPHRVEAFTGALRRIARLSGSPETARGWRHFSIARRCAFLEDVLANPAAAARFEGWIAGVRTMVVITAALLAVLAMLLLTMPPAPPSEADYPEDPAGPEDVGPPVRRHLVRLVDGHEMDAVAFRPPQFHRDADVAAHPDDGRLAGLGQGVAARDHEVAVPQPRGHAVAVDPQGERAARLGTEAGQVEEFRQAVGGGRG